MHDLIDGLTPRSFFYQYPAGLSTLLWRLNPLSIRYCYFSSVRIDVYTH